MTGELILTTILPRKVAKPDRETERQRDRKRDRQRECERDQNMVLNLPSYHHRDK